jgi:hypothetical protein
VGRVKVQGWRFGSIRETVLERVVRLVVGGYVGRLVMLVRFWFMSKVTKDNILGSG